MPVKSALLRMHLPAKVLVSKQDEFEGKVQRRECQNSLISLSLSAVITD